MRRFHVSVAGLMGITILIAVGFAALRNPTGLWASIVFTLTLALMSTAILGAIARRGRARTTWSGLAVFGWVYLSMTFGPWPNANGVTVPPFPTMAVYEYLWRSNPNAPRGSIVIRDLAPHGESLYEASMAMLIPE